MSTDRAEQREAETGDALTTMLAALRLAEPMLEVMHSMTMSKEAELAMAERLLAVRRAIEVGIKVL